MTDTIDSIILNGVEVQLNGIIRNKKGRLIGRLIDSCDYDSEHVKGLAEKHLPQSISREAVVKLREKRGNKDNEYADTSIMQFIKDLDILLCNQKDD